MQIEIFCNIFLTLTINRNHINIGYSKVKSFFLASSAYLPMIV